MTTYQRKGWVQALRAFGLLAIAMLFGCSGSVTPEAAVTQAEHLIETGKQSEARVRLKALLAKYPETAQARVLLAQMALDSGDMKAAENELSQLTAVQLQEPKAQVLWCWVQLGLGKHAEVLEALEHDTLVVDSTERARIHAAALRDGGTPADALQILRSAADKSPTDAAIAVDLAETFVEIGNLEQARYELDRFLERVPGQADALETRGALQLRNGATAKAVEDLRAALASAPPSWHPLQRINVQMLLGEAGLASGNLALSKEQLAALEKDHPGALAGQLLAAGIALFEGRAGDAADALQVVARAVPDNPRVQYMLADAWIRSGNTARAIDLLEQRVRAAPTDATARRLLARLVRKTRPDQVIELLGELPQEQIEPGSEEGNLLSAARVAQGQTNEALELVQKKITQQPDNPDLQLELAFAYLQNGQPTRALSVLNRLNTSLSPAAAALEMRAHIASGNDRETNRLVAALIQSGTTTVDTLLAAADSAQVAGRQDATTRLIDESLRRESNNAGALLRRANLEFVDRNYMAAEKTLREIIELNPGDVQARTALARVAEAKGDLQAAQVALQVAVQMSPGKVEPALMLAALHLRSGQAEQATRVFDQLIKSSPTNGVAANAAGLVLLKVGRAEEARARFGQAVEQVRSDARYWFNLGRAQVLATDRQAAAQSFERAVALRPQWVEANTAAIQLSLESKQVARARELTKAFVARLPVEPGAWLMEGQVAMMESRLVDAVAAFARSYALRPSAVAAAREFQARMASSSLRPAQPLLNWLTQEPTDINVRRLLAGYYQQVGATKELVAQLEKILATMPNDATSLNNLAWAIMKLEPGRAESLARRANAISPQQPAFADTLGRALIINGKYADAVRVLGGAVQGLPKDPSVRTRYAFALARSGDHGAARREAQTALRNGGAFEERETAEKLLRELGT